MLPYSEAHTLIDKAMHEYFVETGRPPFHDGEPCPVVIETDYRQIVLTTRFAQWLCHDFADRVEHRLKIERDAIYASAARRRQRQASLDLLDALTTEVWGQACKCEGQYDFSVMKCRARDCDLQVGADAPFTSDGYCQSCLARALGMPDPAKCSYPECQHYAIDRGFCTRHQPTATKGTTP